METQDVFFTLTGNELEEVATRCMNLLDQLIVVDEKKALSEDFMLKFTNLKKRMFDTYDSNPETFDLNIQEAFILQYAYSQSAYMLKTYTMMPEENKEEEEREQLEMIFQTLQDFAPDLFWRLTKALNYSEVALDTLENVFDIETGVVRPIKISLPNEDEYDVNLAINASNYLAIRFSVTIINSLLLFGDESEFAKRFSEHQFMNTQDFLEFHYKVCNIKEDGIVHLSVKENIILFWTMALCQRIFVTDAADIIESISKDIPQEEYQKMRSFVLNFNSLFMKEMETIWAKEEQVMTYFNKVKEWKF